MFSNKLLVKIAIYTAVFGTSGCTYVFLKQQHDLKSSPYFAKSMQLLEDRQDVADYLGKPLKYGFLNLGDVNNYCDGLKAQFEVPVKGSKKSGSMHLWAERDNPEKEWDVIRLEFLPSKNLTKRVLIKQQEQ